MDKSLINNNKVSSDSVRQEVVQVITLELKTIYEKDGCKTMLAKKLLTIGKSRVRKGQND